MKHLLLLLGVLGAATPALATHGYAVVIGNDAYPGHELHNAVADATDIGGALRDLDFEVHLYADVTLPTLRQAVATLQSHAAEPVVFFFGGHGVQVNGENYLLPIDVTITQPSDVPRTALAAGVLFAALGAERKQPAIIILDACRNNPYATLSSGDWIPGLAPPQGAPANTLVAFATDPGNVASDGVGKHSPYTRALLRHIGTAGETVDDFLKTVRTDVMANTDSLQTPWETSSLTQTYRFRDEVFILARFTEPADDDALLIANNEQVLTWGNDKDAKKRVTLRTGSNELIVKVYNQRSFTGGIQGLGGHLPEGWHYGLDLQRADGTLLLHLHDCEDEPEDNGPHHGKLFTVANMVMSVDRRTGAVTLASHTETHIATCN